MVVCHQSDSGCVRLSDSVRLWLLVCVEKIEHVLCYCWWMWLLEKNCHFIPDLHSANMLLKDFSTRHPMLNLLIICACSAITSMMVCLTFQQSPHYSSSLVPARSLAQRASTPSDDLGIEHDGLEDVDASLPLTNAYTRSYHHRFNFTSFPRAGEWWRLPKHIVPIHGFILFCVLCVGLSASYDSVKPDVIHKSAECRVARSMGSPRIAILLAGAARVLSEPVAYESIVNNILVPLSREGTMLSTTCP